MLEIGLCQIKSIRRAWSESKAFRRVLIIVLLYLGLRLAVQGVVLIEMSSASGSEDAGQFALGDLQVYLDAADRLMLRQDLYLIGPVDLLEHYIYSPAYALAFTPFLLLPAGAVALLHTLLHILAYGLLYIWWGKIFTRLGLKRADEALAWTLPVWIVFSAFWSDLGYLNIYIFMALLATLLIDAILDERLVWSVLWLSFILQVKPHWAFAVAVPLLLGRYRFFFKLLLSALLVYLAIAGITVLMVGPSYGWQQYQAYIQFLLSLRGKFPWRGPEAHFLGYNHSITQLFVYLLGATPATLRLALILKMLLLIPLGLVSLHQLFHPVKQAGRRVPELSLSLAFALYLGAFIWLDVVWELTLGIVVFTFLLSILKAKTAKIVAWTAFIPYVLVDFGQLMSFILFGSDVILPGLYIATDPSIYIPITMIVILTFYTLLMSQPQVMDAPALGENKPIRMASETRT